MVTFVTAKSSITAVTAAALLAGLMAFLASAVPEAKAESERNGSVRATHHQGDRLPTHVTGAACSAQSWPNYDVACQFDHRRPPSEAQAVRRVIALR
jgi:hypothetical protein